MRTSDRTNALFWRLHAADLMKDIPSLVDLVNHRGEFPPINTGGMSEFMLTGFKRYCEHLTRWGYDLVGGNCLDIAVGLAEAYMEKQETASVVLLTRVDDDDSAHEILSHAVVRIGNDTYDKDGGRAIERWERDFNQTRHMNNEEEVMFDEEEFTGAFFVFYDECQKRFVMEHASKDLAVRTSRCMGALLGVDHGAL